MARMTQNQMLEKLFGSAARLRLLRLFLLNPEEVFDAASIVKRTRLKPEQFKKDMDMLREVGYLKPATRIIAGEVKKGEKPAKQKVIGYSIDKDFPFLNELSALLSSSAPQARDRLLSGARSLGRVSFLLIAGRLLGYETEHVDVFLAGDALKKSKIEMLLHAIEAETGQEIVYAMMATKEFTYRYGMNDRFVSTLFDAPHEVLINKVEVLTPAPKKKGSTDVGDD